MDFRFASPAWLLLLPLALGLVWALGLRLTALSPARRYTVLILRTLLFTLLILALARLELTRRSDELAVMFVVDESDSVPAELRQYSRLFVQKALQEMGPKDEAGIVVFGAEASIERNPQDNKEFEEFASAPNRNQTNIAEAIRLAMAAMPPHAKKRIVLLSDGNETAGDVEEAARTAASNRVALDVAPLSYEFREDTILSKVVVENQVDVNAPFDIKVFVESQRATQGKLNIFQDGQLIVSQPVTIKQGKNTFIYPDTVGQLGFHVYSAQMEAPEDANPENNTAEAYTMAQGEPRVLYVEGQDPEEERLVPLLRAEKINVDMILPDQFPHNIALMQNYNCIIFNNVPASAVTQSQQRLLERAVRDMGMGFIMIGGPDSFGAGGWQDTPVEEALPVDMEIKHKKVLPQGALALILHTIEIAQGEYWAREIGVAALNVLSTRDLFGVLAYDWQTREKWVVPLAPAENKAAIRQAIHAASNGDMPSFDKTLEMAYEGLSKTNASVKHIVIISDGDAAYPSPSLVSKIRNSKITISTVHIGGHSPANKATMEALAKAGGGNFYAPPNSNQLPQIFVKEASVVRKSLIFEEPFRPVQKSYSEVLTGISESEYPTLQGYVGSSPKDLANVPLKTDKDDPLLAHWRYGLGKTAAYTSDATLRWARDWFTWQKMGKFWAQLTRWALRAQTSRNLQTTVQLDQGKGTATVDAVDDQGKFLNFLNLQAQVINPDFEGQTLDFRQTGPGRYEATFDTPDVGAYLLTVRASNDAGFDDIATGGASISYSPEFQTSRSNEALMNKLKETGHGRLLDQAAIDAGARVFDPLLPTPGEARPQPVWPALLMTALFLLLLDIFFRRVLVDWSMLREGMAVFAGAVATRIRPRRVAATRDERMASLMEAKRQAGAARPAAPEAAPRPVSARKELLERLDNSEARDLVERAEEGKPAPKTAAPSAAPPEETKKEDNYTSKLLQAKKRAKR